jgi:signal transduction histidine kinase
VEKILDVARLEGDLVKLNKKEFDLSKLLKEIIEEYQGQFKIGSTTISFQSKLHKAEIYGDALHTANVFHNLIDNAIKYGGQPAHVTIEMWEEDDKILVSVKDNGPGIAKKELSKIFDKFYRISTGDVHNIKGFGLGLYYVQQIVRLHRWSIDVESEQGSYAKFLINIPKLN